MTIAKIIIPLEQVPDDAIVTKRTGQMKSTVQSEINIYYSDKPPQSITATGCKFLVNARGQSNATPNDTEVVWYVQEHEKEDMIEVFGLTDEVYYS